MDELLLRRAQQGDTEAFEQLLTPLEKMIWRVCWHYTGEREAANDCGQDAMVRIWRNLQSYRGTAPLKPGFTGWRPTAAWITCEKRNGTGANPLNR